VYGLKLGTIVVLDIMSKPTDFGFKRSMVRGTESSFQNGNVGTPSIYFECLKIDISYLVHLLNTTGISYHITNYP